MVINELHISAFGGLIDRDLHFDHGLNIIEGANESGKTSAAMFIKFIFYGLSGKAPNGALSEKRRYINFEKNAAAGYLICTENGVKYRIERSLSVIDGDGNVRETVNIVNLNDGSIKHGVSPGEYFFGVSESIFVNTVFVGQLGGIRPDGESLSGAIENMLSAADENVNLKKAADRLNQARREIQHKHGNGGELNALKEERALLADEMSSSTVTAEELISAEAALTDAQQKQAQLKQKKEKLDGISHALDLILVKKKLDSVTHTEEKVKSLREAVDKIDRSGFLTRHIETLNQAERDIRAYRETAEVPAEAPADSVHKAAPINTVSAPEEVLDDAYYLDTKSRVRFTAALSMVIAAIMGLATTAALYYFNTGTYLLPLGIAGVCALLGIVFFLMQHKTLSDLYALLDEWKAETIDDLELMLDPETVDSEPVPVDDPYISDLYTEAMGDLEAKAASGEATVLALAKSLGIEPQRDALATAASIREYGERLASTRESIVARAENFAGRLSVLKEQLATVDAAETEREMAQVAATPYGKLALTLDADGIKRVIRERDFTTGAYNSQTQHVAELESTLSALKLQAKSPASAATRIEEIDEQIRELELKRDGYNLAMEALKQAGENMRSGVVPKLAAYASEIMSKAVDGKYDTLMPNAKFDMSYPDGAETRSVEHLSKGTHDAAYLSLRLAMMKVVYQNALPPIILDESFAYIDENRFINLLRCIADSDRQSIFFTCREKETAEANEGTLHYNMIQM